MDVVSLLELGYSYNWPSRPDRSPNLVYCAHDGHTKLHPPCYRNEGSANVDGCIADFTGKRKQPDRKQPIWTQRQQREALERWSQSHQRLDITIWKEGLDLQFFFQLFDDFFFCSPGRALTHRVEVQWTDYTPGASHCQTTIVPSSTDKYPGALIKIPKADPSQPFTGQTALRTLSTLLHEMAHAFLICYACDCNTCRCDVTRSDTVGLTGHGPVWVKLCEAIEAEANEKLKGLPGCWDLDCRDDGTSLRGERRARGMFGKNALVATERGRRAGL